MLRQVRVRYEGQVQGVGFRYTVGSLANRLEVAGTVENRPDGTVRLVAEGTEAVLKTFLLNIRTSRLGDYISGEHLEWARAEGLSGFYAR
ncbi:MAG: acylphosphatase [Verrucomicrobiota bacterium]|jgi:acylphosphatase|nr:acylphosphatase [Verrucomicrobiota bacterium]